MGVAGHTASLFLAETCYDSSSFLVWTHARPLRVAHCTSTTGCYVLLFVVYVYSQPPGA